jgi:diacylglycerol O-acyltransferase / wax synthase
MSGNRGSGSRLTGLDTAFLAMENRYSQMHTLKFGIFESCIPGKSLTADAIWVLLRTHLHAVPCYTQKLMFVPFGLHHPLLVNAVDFDISNQVHVVTVPEPGGRRERDAVIADICGGTLDRGRPLWELWILEGLQGGRVGCLMKLHHTLADGRVAGNQLQAFAAASEADLLVADNAPTRTALIRDALIDRARDTAKLPGLIRDTYRAMRVTRRIRRDSQAQVPGLTSCPSTLFDQRVGQTRTWGTVSVPLSVLSSVAKHYKVSINDVFLTMFGSAARRYLIDHGTLPRKSLTAGLPVDTSSEADAGALQGNRWAMLMTTLATDEPDIVKRLYAIRGSMNVGKQLRKARGDLMERWAQYINLPLVQKAITAVAGSRLASAGLFPAIGASNVKGPDSAPVVGELRVCDFYSVGPLNHNGINVTAWSYAGQFNISLLSGRNLIPDASMFLGPMIDALHELAASAGIDWQADASVQRMTS